MKKIVFILCAFGTLSLSAQLRISEFMASNAITIADPDFQEYSDWIEIENQGSTAVNLKGYYLTDNLSKPDKWQITTDIQIPAGGFHVFWADDQDSGNHTNFKLSLEGEELALVSADLQIIDQVIFPYQKPDVSYGRKEGNSWFYFDQPTPGVGNNTTGYSDFIKYTPDVNVAGRIFAGSLSLRIYTERGGLVRYTADGTEPTFTSAVFPESLNITQSMIIRARVFAEGQLPGPVVTHSYFAENELHETSLPVVSLVSDPDNFWDTEKGIYVQDFKPEWEIPVNVELFENNGSDRAGFNELTGVKINGLYSWQLPQKMLGVYFRGKYGSGSLDYPLFYDRERGSFKSFALRASGSDWSYTLFRDILGQDLASANTTLDIQGQRPTIVFINGQYMGIHNIRSKVDEDFIVGNHGHLAGSFDMIENEEYAEVGSLDEYAAFKALYSKDLSVQANYDAVAAQMDIDNFTDLVITEIYVRNTSIGHNVMAWKPHGTGKWKWILMDLDRGFFSPQSNLIDYFESQTVWPFSQLMKNAGYRAYFLERVAFQMSTTFHPDRVKSLIDAHAAVIANEVPYHVARWQGTTSSYGDALPSVAYWQEQVQYLKTFAEQRPQMILNDLLNYGAESMVSFSVSNPDTKAGELLVGGMRVSTATAAGAVPSGTTVSFAMEVKPGYDFKGWKSLISATVLANGSDWKYLDNGADAGSDWILTSYDDASWKSGPAQLGYGEGDEATTVSYGSSSSNKYVTTYFRKKFTVTESAAQSYTLRLQCDDGALVYLNGQEVARFNMPTGNVNYQTLATAAISGAAESAFNEFTIDNTFFIDGENQLAVEVHQAEVNSSDVSFDLELLALVPSAGYYSTHVEASLVASENFALLAETEKVSNCVLGGEVSADLELTLDCSPYLVVEDLIISSQSQLTIQPGVILYFSDGVSLMVHGKISAAGTSASPIIFKSNPEAPLQKWGAITLEQTSGVSDFTYVKIENASHGYHKNQFPAALSAFYGDFSLDHVTIENVNSNPVAARYSSVKVSNSMFHSEVTGDLINVKYGGAHIYNCDFVGNDQPDTDAVDLDDVVDGVVRNCRISHLLGSNSDGVDIGERAENILLDSLVIYHVTDKGVSVGQQSSVKLTNSIIMNCNLGMGLKDSCKVTVDRCTFYGNQIGISAYEKNLGSAGGNVRITNSILSNSYTSTLFKDAFSTMALNYSITDTDTIAWLEGQNLVDPLFDNPVQFGFGLQANSPAKAAGISDGTAVDLGAPALPISFPAQPMFSGLFVNDDNLDLPEFIKIFNPNEHDLDLSGFAVVKGVTVAFPQGTILGGQDTLILTSNASHSFWDNSPSLRLEWPTGKLSNDGETVVLMDDSEIIVDQVRYNQSQWPSISGNTNIWWQLKDAELDNHFAQNWEALPMIEAQLLGVDDMALFEVFPNPVAHSLKVRNRSIHIIKAQLITIDGQEIMDFELDSDQISEIDVRQLKSGIYLLKMEAVTYRLIIRH